MVANTRFLEGATSVVAACRDGRPRDGDLLDQEAHATSKGVLERDGVAELFDVVIGHEDVARAKPAPMRCTRRSRGSTSARIARSTSAITPSTRKRRRGAGVAFVAVLTGPSRREEFGAHAVREFLASIDEVPRALRALSKR